MPELTPVRTVALGVATVHPTQQKMSISGTPMPHDIAIAIQSFFGSTDISPEEMVPLYQYILSESESANPEDIQATLSKLSIQLEPTERQKFEKVRDLAISHINNSGLFENLARQRDVLEKELPALERQANETGDWRFFFRASERKDRIDETVHSQLNE